MGGRWPRASEGRRTSGRQQRPSSGGTPIPWEAQVGWPGLAVSHRLREEQFSATVTAALAGRRHGARVGEAGTEPPAGRLPRTRGETMSAVGEYGMPGGGSRLDSEVGYGVPLGAGLVGTPRVGGRTSEYGQDYRLGLRHRGAPAGHTEPAARDRRRTPGEPGVRNAGGRREKSC